jgi:hypothetical protein
LLSADGQVASHEGRYTERTDGVAADDGRCQGGCGGGDERLTFQGLGLGGTKREGGDADGFGLGNHDAIAWEGGHGSIGPASTHGEESRQHEAAKQATDAVHGGGSIHKFSGRKFQVDTPITSTRKRDKVNP